MEIPIELFISFFAGSIAIAVFGFIRDPQVPVMLTVSGVFIVALATMTSSIVISNFISEIDNMINESHTDQYKQLSRSGSNALRNGSSTFYGERINSVDSVLYDKDIDEVCFALGKTGTPLGMATIAIYNTLSAPSATNFVYLFGTIDVSTLPTTGLATYCFTHTATNQDYSLYLNVAFGVFYNGGSVGNQVNIDVVTPQVFDGSNTIAVRYSGSWISESNIDVYGLARLNIIEEIATQTNENITIEFTEFPKTIFALFGAILIFSSALMVYRP